MARRRIRLKDLRDTEIQQLRCAIGCNQDVSRFDVPMNDQMLMGKLHGRGNLQENSQPFGNRELEMVAVLGDRPPLDQFHRNVWDSILCCAAIEQSRDIWMFETGQNLALVLESSDDRVGILTCADNFQRHLLAILIVGTKGAIDFTHASRPDLLHDPISADTSSDPRVVFDGNESCSGFRKGGFAEKLRAGLLLTPKQELNLAAERIVANALSIEIGSALMRRQFQRRGENFLDSVPAFRSHSWEWLLMV